MNYALRNTSKSTTLVLMGNLNFPVVNWGYHTAGTNRSKRLLKHMDDNFMEQVLREPTRKDALLDLLLVNTGSNEQSGDWQPSWPQ